jgi:uncharacterized phage infection (PIP) family protein YhgE
MDLIARLWELPFENLIFIYVILASFTLFLIVGLRNRGAFVHGPTILTMIGILGTFWGVAQGLIKFDPENVKGGLPTLLGGLKTAFYASIFGVGGAIVLKTLSPVLGGVLRRGQTTYQGATVGDVVKAIGELKNSVGGEGESTLVSQLKLLRQDTNDRLDSLQRAQTEALKQLSQMGSATLVEALQQVIRDFNQKITEQFGDNFKQLNQAVGKLLEWQRQHVEHVEAVTEGLTQLISQSDSIVQNQAQLNAHSQSFVTVSNALSGLIASLETQKSQLLAMVASLGQVLEKSSGALPEIEKKIVELANQMVSASKQSQEILSSSLKETSAELKRNLESVVAETNRSHADHSKKIADQVEKSKQQIELLDAALSEELAKALEALGRQLAALSEKFTSDYSPLADRLREIVRIAARSPAP